MRSTTRRRHKGCVSQKREDLMSNCQSFVPRMTMCSDTRVPATFVVGSVQRPLMRLIQPGPSPCATHAYPFASKCVGNAIHMRAKG